MSFTELFSVAKQAGNFAVNYINDGWLQTAEFKAKSPGQLMYLWQCFAEKHHVSINAVTQIDEVIA